MLRFDHHAIYGRQNGEIRADGFVQGHEPGVIPIAWSESSVVSSRAAGLPLTPPGSPDEGGRGSMMQEGSITIPPPKHCMGTSGTLSAHNMTTPSVYNQPSLDSLSTGILNSPTSYMPGGDALKGLADVVGIRAGSVYSCMRGEKKPVPDGLKDQKYYERRKRNNIAAKKSRVSRKNREEEIAARAAFLEKDNAVLRAQVATLHEEAQQLRLLLLQKQRRMGSCQGQSSSFG